MNKNFDIYNKLFLRKGRLNNIFALISGVEHVGSSWCMLNLAYALSCQNQKVLLIDGNGHLSNVGSYIMLRDPLYLENYFRGNNTLNQLLTAYKNNDFHILTASFGNNYLEDLPLGRTHIFTDDISILAQNYASVLIDVGTNITKNSLNLCQMANHIFILCSEKSADLVKNLEIMQILHKSEIKANYHLIINRVNSFEDGYKIYKEFTKALNYSHLPCPNLLGMVRFDTRIRDTIRNKELLLSRYPTSEAAVDICGIAQKLTLENGYE